ncbi:MAG: hypothetical protein ACRBBW_14020 [Cellvibrionaceae bacterium]
MLVFGEQTQSRIQYLSERRFGKSADADIAASYVLEQLSADDWQVCHKFTGKARPQTYLYTLCANFIEEYARKRFGRIRPPQWLQQLGNQWLTLWKYICLERQPIPVVIERFSDDENSRNDAESVLSMITTIKAKIPWCGQQTGEVSLELEADNSPHEVHHSSNHDATQEEFLLLLHNLVLGETEDPSSTVMAQWQDQNKLTSLKEQLQLSDEQRLILRMAYQDNLKFSAIARTLKLPAHQPARIAQRALKHIQQLLLEHQLLPSGLTAHD